MNVISEAKRAARSRAEAVRDGAHASMPGAGRIAAGHALGVLAKLHGVRRVSAFLSFRSEIATGPLIAGLHGLGYEIGLPVVQGRARPLVFRRWAPGAPLMRGNFGVEVPPADAPEMVPEVLFVPLLAFTASGHRLGYGGGFYDRTLAALREAGAPVTAIGFAYGAQRVAELPLEATDLALDAVVTEAGVMHPG